MLVKGDTTTTWLVVVAMAMTLSGSYGRLARRGPTNQNIDSIKLELEKSFDVVRDADKPLSGLTVMNDRVYAVFKGASVINVYDAKTFERLEDIELTDPYDPLSLTGFEAIASCNDDNTLIIQDSDWNRGTMYVWRLDLTHKDLWPWLEEPINIQRDVSMTGKDCRVTLTRTQSDLAMTVATVYNSEGINIRNLPVPHSLFKPKSIVETVDGTFVMIDALDKVAMDMNQRGAILRKLDKHDETKNAANINWPESGTYDKFGNLFVIDTYQDAVDVIARDLSRSRTILPGGEGMYRKSLTYDVKDQRLFVISQHLHPNVYVYKIKY